MTENDRTLSQPKRDRFSQNALRSNSYQKSRFAIPQKKQHKFYNGF